MTWHDMLFQGWYGVLRVLCVGALAYGTLVLFLRISGKRTLAKLNAFDLIVTVALGSTLSAILLQKSIPLLDGAVALGLLIALQYLVTFLSVRSASFAKLIRSSPSELVRNGRVCPQTMRDERVTMDEALGAVRAEGGRGFDDVETLTLESDGKLSVIFRGGARP